MYPTSNPDGRRYRNAATREAVSAPGVGVEMLYVVICNDGSSSYRFGGIAEYIDPQVVIAAAYDQAISYLPEPSLDVWPPPDVGAPVQFGLWLAVDDPGQINAFSEIGPVWASVTARLQRTTYDMGNGDVVECDGIGSPHVPLPDPTDYSPGPCGYVYRSVDDLGLRHVTVTGHWTVQLVTSTGINEMLDPLTMTTEFDYEIYEIVTVIVATGSG